MGRLLTILVVGILIVAVWAILVAPDYDLDDTVVRGKVVIAWVLGAVLAGCIEPGRAMTTYLAPWNFLREAYPSLLELTCSRLC